MGRMYTELDCGCMISCDGGGGLIPCDGVDCEVQEYFDKHSEDCPWCGECVECYPHGIQEEGCDYYGYPSADDNGTV